MTLYKRREVWRYKLKRGYLGPRLLRYSDWYEYWEGLKEMNELRGD